MGLNSKLLRDDARHEAGMLSDDARRKVSLSRERTAPAALARADRASQLRQSGVQLSSTSSAARRAQRPRRVPKRARERAARWWAAQGRRAAMLGWSKVGTAYGAADDVDDDASADLLSDMPEAAPGAGAPAKRARKAKAAPLKKGGLLVEEKTAAETAQAGKTRASGRKAQRQARAELEAVSAAPAGGSVKADMKAKRAAKRRAWQASVARRRAARAALEGFASKAAAFSTEASGAARTAVKGLSSGLAAGLPVAGGMLATMLSALLALAVFMSVFITMQKEEFNLEGMSEAEAAVAMKLYSMGWNNAQIAGAMGNIACESGFIVDRVEGDAHVADPRTAGYIGLGLMMWTTQGSHDKLAEIAEAKHKSWTDIDVQLEMLEYWIGSVFQGSASYVIGPGSDDPPDGTLASGSREAFDRSNDVEECTRHFCYVAERPSIPHYSRRVERARYYYGILQAAGGPGSSMNLIGGRLGDPMTGYPWVLSSSFGPRDGGYHNGMDMAAPEGTPYYAAESGTVLYATNDGGYNGGAGNWVVIDHGGGIVTKYMHSSRVFVVPGQKVKKGDHIGNVGNTGQSFGAHLHFQVEINGTPVDPAGYLKS